MIGLDECFKTFRQAFAEAVTIRFLDETGTVKFYPYTAHEVLSFTTARDQILSQAEFLDELCM